MKKLLVLLLLAVCAVPFEAHAEQRYCSIGEIVKNTPARWTETYETPSGTIAVDIPVEVPAVDRFPVVKIQLMPAVSKDRLSEYKEILHNSPGTLGADKKAHDWIENAGPKDTYTYLNGERPLQQPDNVSLSYEEICALCFQELDHLFSLKDTDFRIEKVRVEGRAYYYRQAGMKIIWKEPANDTGRYALTFRQLFHGIETEAGTACYDDNGMGLDKGFRSAYCYISLSGPENIKIRAALYDELETVYDDVPLLSFADAKKAIESEIEAGYLYSIDTMKLCYVPYQDASDKNIFWLLPAWYAKGAYMRSVILPVETDENGLIRTENMEQKEVIFQAQSGTLIDYTDTGKDRRIVPAVLTWNDIEKE